MVDIILQMLLFLERKMRNTMVTEIKYNLARFTFVVRKQKVTAQILNLTPGINVVRAVRAIPGVKFKLYAVTFCSMFI